MITDETILSSIPGYIRFDCLMKASPVEESGRRILYLEASNEDVDRQGEVVLQKALAESADFYLRHGNVDISHYSLIGRKQGIQNPESYEIGTPLEVNVDGSRTFVKAELYQGESAQAANATMVWDSITKQTPPMRWYPSVGGAVLSKSVRIGKDGGKVGVIDKVRWSNIALDRTPVNATVPEASTVPLGMFAKAFGGFVLKTLEAGYGTDSSGLIGGGALRTQSLHGTPISYFDFKNQLARKIRRSEISHNKADWLEFAAHCMASPEYVGRFIRELRNNHD